MSNSTEINTSNAIATPDLVIVDGQITTTSQQVAEHFGKQHKLVLRAIRGLMQQIPAEHQCNFAPMTEAIVVGGGAKRQSPYFRITRDGFTLLAMGFTGKEAMHWKLAYIDAFNKMEAQLLAQAAKAQPVQASLDYDRISPAQAQDLKQIVQAIVDAGIQKYAETWARLQRKFKVHSYLALHPDQYEAARAYLIAKLPNGYEGDEVESKPAATKMSLDDAVRLDLAFSMSAQAGAQVQRSVFAAVMQGDLDWKTKRYVSNLTYDRMSHQLTAPATRAMDHGEMITSLDTLPKWLNGEDPVFATDEQLANIAAACTLRLARSAASRQPALRHDA